MRVEDANSSSVFFMMTVENAYSSSVSVWWEWKMLTVVWKWEILKVVVICMVTVENASSCNVFVRWEWNMLIYW